jgi:hypothetical protein
MTRFLRIAALALACPSIASAQVFISEVFVNPPGSFDSSKEFIELQGTPGKKLDGYAVALFYGRMESLINQGQMPPQLADEPEIDEFFSLDGLALGRNGLLVIGIGADTDYPLAPDTAFANWLNLWNGPLDTPNKLNNDGSTTLLLVRNRPGATQANPFDPPGPIWVKDGSVDREVTFGVIDPQDGLVKDQIGNGKLDVGGINVIGTPMFDHVGSTTNANAFDDLEVVDEVSWEHERGWEYDLDRREVDLGSTQSGIKERNVHTLDDPQGINPDVITRVDYRTKGTGYPPLPGATGELPNGNNWQDTATEQWIRGESVQALFGGFGPAPYFYYDANSNPDPAALQPYLTNVPLWLADGVGAEFPYTPFAYQILAGNVNALATPFIPGDVDRDGDCDGDDLTATLSVFGQPDWLFINSWPAAPNGDSSDPATQLRPWNLDGTGDNGIDPSDLQWVLNFQGDTTGRTVGVSYDASGPAANGVVLADNQPVAAAITTSVSAECAPSLSQLRLNDVIEVVVSAEIIAGGDTAPGRENGVMQFVHDIQFTIPGILEVIDVTPIAPFVFSNPTLIDLPFGGTFGANQINGYTTDFTRGLNGPAPLYRVRIRAVNAGNSGISVSASSAPQFWGSTPYGIKIGHTIANGDPGSATYIALNFVSVTNTVGGFIGEYGTGCVGSGGFTPRLQGSGCASPGSAITLSIRDGKPGAAPNLFIGLGNGVAAINPNCSIQNLPVLGSPIVLFPLPGSGDGNGALTLSGLVIPATVPLGVSTYLQAFFSDAGGFGGFSATNPLKLTFGN